MKKVVSFSLWGDKPKYLIGAIKNTELCKLYYPQFECWFYVHNETVPIDTINKLKSYDNVKIIFKNGDLDKIKPMMWRFEPIDDPDVCIMMSRDTDTRIWLREVLAVDEWLHSDKLFHIMRDHPYHGEKILGGMFGTKKIPQISSWTDMINKYVQNGHIGYDQVFLRNFIYPIVVNDSIIHDSFFRWEAHSKPFPIPFSDNYNFVGEYVYEDESRNQTHINMVKERIGKL